MKWLYTTLWVMLAILPVLNGLLKPPPPAEPLILFVNIIAAAAIGGFIAHDVWKLRVRSWPLAIDVLIYAVLLLAFFALILLKEIGVWHWNDTHLDIPLFVFFLVTTTTVWITERKKGVKVYLGARKLIFISA
jgi:hypothetical protein